MAGKHVASEIRNIKMKKNLSENCYVSFTVTTKVTVLLYCIEIAVELKIIRETFGR